jgi:biopolymer transport protein ExbB
MKKQLKYLFVITSLISTGFIYAQDQVAPVATTTAAETGKIVEEISALEFLMKGGVFLIPIALLLFYTSYVAVERYLYIKRMTKQNKNILKQVEPYIKKAKNSEDEATQKNELQNAINSLSSEKNAFGNVILEGVESFNRPITHIESNMEKVANIEIGKMEKNIGHLGLIAGIAPTLGFIGTISGVIKIFYSISVTENVSIGNISGGLYEKMISSGSGLVVGIIAFTAYHLLNGMIDNYALAIQRVNLEFIKLNRPSDGNKA